MYPQSINTASDMAAFAGYIESTWDNSFKSIVKYTNTTIWSFMDALKLEHSLTAKDCEVPHTETASSTTEEVD